MYRLPASLRSALKTPMGPVLDTDKALEVMDRAGVLVTVGDVVTRTCLDAGVVPKLMIVDGRTKREDLEGNPLASLDATVENRNVTNPAATITDELWEAVEDGLQDANPVVLNVEGEEDLAALPALLLAPQGAVVAYGQPDEGVVVVQVDGTVQARVRDLLDRMET